MKCAPAASGSRDVGITQPRDHSLANPCIQGSAKRWSLGCVNSPPRGQEAGFTQPKAHLLADRCGCDKTLYSAEQLDIRHDEAVLSLRTMMRKVFPHRHPPPLMSRRRGRFMPDRGSKRKVSFNDSQILSIHISVRPKGIFKWQMRELAAQKKLPKMDVFGDFLSILPIRPNF